MLPFGLQGFHNASISKAAIATVCILSLLASILNHKTALHLQIIPHMTRHHQFWRLITHNLAFANSAELLIAALMLYNLRVIERVFGSLKYASMILVTCALSSLLSLVALILLAPTRIKYIPAGPFGVVFAVLYQYQRMIPPTYRFRVFGITITDKAFIWFFAMQLVLSQFPQSLIACACGYAAGMMYRSDATNLKKWRVPFFVQKAAGKVTPLLGTSLASRSTATTRSELERFLNEGRSSGSSLSSAVRATRRVATTTTTTTGSDTATDQAANAAPAAAPAQRRTMMREYFETLSGQSEGMQAPREGDVGALQELFPTIPREEIVRSLQASNFDTNAAVGLLLASGGTR